MFGISEARIYKFCTQIGYVKPNGHDHGHMTVIKLCTPIISLEWLKLGSSHLICKLIVWSS